MPNNKAKGSKNERELVEIFTNNSWRAVRVAGSGVNDNSPCDMIVGKIGRKGYTVEAKSSKKAIIYITKAQISDFVTFSMTIGLTPVIALRFNRQGWLFIEPKDLRDTGTNWAASLKNALEKGKRFAQFFEIEEKIEE